MTMLGFLTGLRPSTLRLLRRRGPHADVLWQGGHLLVRRLQTHGDEVMESTKTGKDQRIALPGEVLEILRQHVEQLQGAAAESDLLSPSTKGGFRSRSCLDKPFAKVCRELARRPSMARTLSMATARVRNGMGTALGVRARTDAAVRIVTRLGLCSRDARIRRGADDAPHAQPAGK